MPVEAYGALPAVSSASISPDGKHVILAVAHDNQVGFEVLDVDSGRTVQSARMEEGMRLDHVDWANDEIATFTASRAVRAGELPTFVYASGHPHFLNYSRVGTIRLADGTLNYLQNDPYAAWAALSTDLVAPIEGDPGFGRMLGVDSGADYRTGQSGAMRWAIFRINLQTGRRDLSALLPDQVYQLLFNARGEMIARTDTSDANNRWRLYAYDRQTARQVLEDQSDTGAPPLMQGALTDGRIVVELDRIDGGRDGLAAINLANGAREILHQTDRYDVDYALRDKWTRVVVGAEWIEDFPVQHFFDADLAAAYESIKPLFASGYAVITSWSRDHSRLLIEGERGDDAGALYVYDRPHQNLMRLRQFYPQLDGVLLGRRQAITYRARDGVRIPAYLTTPEVGTRFPLIVLVHGGPESRDTFQFDYLPSFLSSRGYAVLQSNYRGSSGYGAAWSQAGHGQWGDGVMQTDVDDGVDALVRAGVADPAKVCIVGASYGGYSALAGVTLTPDRYKCAVSIAGVSDLSVFLNRTVAETGSRSIATDWWHMLIGDPRNSAEHIRAISPINLVDRVRAPILLIHGTTDTVVPIEQSRTMAARLRAAGKDVRLVELQGDDHHLSTTATRTQALREIEAFLAAHLSASAPAPTPTP